MLSIASLLLLLLVATLSIFFSRERILFKMIFWFSEIFEYSLSSPEFISKYETAKIAPIPPEITANRIPKKTSFNFKLLLIIFLKL